ncbi:MAG: hypothetical protein ACREEW_16265, partial [Caulobacteraceae bacterium]
LEGAPDAFVVAHGSGRGVALSLAARRIVTVWDKGRWRLAYPLEALLGVELDLDGEVAARAMRGEPRRMLDRQSGAEREVRLRFLFDDARHPDFELVLWPAGVTKAAAAKPREAIAEARRWIGRIEAVLRRTGGALALTEEPPARAPAVRAKPAMEEPPPWDEDDEEAEEEAELD